MNSSLYKYTSFWPQFFENFLVRSSQKFALNDPFELTPGVDSEELLVDQMDAYFDYSVFSLSETYTNLLMWSHYANEHKGIVIEFDTDESIFSRQYYKKQRSFDFITNVKKGRFRRVNDDYYGIQDFPEEVVIDLDATSILRTINPGIPHRVLYNPQRPKLEGNNSILEHFLIKSDAWIYEKEHRIILPLIDVDMLVLNNEFQEVMSSSFWLYESLIDEVEMGKDTFSFFPEDLIDAEMYESTRGAIHYLFENKHQEYVEQRSLIKKMTYYQFLWRCQKTLLVYSSIK